MMNGAPSLINSLFVMADPLPPKWERRFPAYALPAPPRNLAPGLDWSGLGQVPLHPSPKYGRVTHIDIEAKGRGVLLLPGPWYPGMSALKLNGVKGEIGRLGNRMALQLEPGRWQIEYYFRGWPWANRLSALALLLWLLGLGFVLRRRRA